MNIISGSFSDMLANSVCKNEAHLM